MKTERDMLMSWSLQTVVELYEEMTKEFKNGNILNPELYADICEAIKVVVETHNIKHIKEVKRRILFFLLSDGGYFASWFEDSEMIEELINDVF